MTDRVFSPDTEAYEQAGEAQIKAANPVSSAWVAANAGSGKTKVLIDRVARLLLNKAAPDSILCVTYTKAAASEMLGRLFDRLGAWSIMPAEELRAKLAELEQKNAESYTDEDIAAARSLFARALETPGGLRIETIHAFCARILRRFPLEAGIPPGFSEIEEEDAERLWREACRKTLLSHDTDLEALETVSAESGHAGALGAIDALRGHASDLLAFYQSHDEARDALDETLRKALNAPKEDYVTLLAEAMGPAFPVAQLRALLPVLASGNKTDQQTAQKIEEALLATSPEPRWTVYRSIFRTMKGWRKTNPYTQAVAQTDSVVDLLQMKDGEGLEVRRVKDLEARLSRRAAYERSRALLNIGVPVLSAYQSEKSARAALDFDDLIQRTRALLITAMASEWVLFKLDGGLTHVLLDEAQDTSPAQWELLNALMAEFFAGAGRRSDPAPRTQFVVGDEKQSIFSFQGADPQRFLDERRAFEARARAATGQAVLPDMAMSFRSSPEILSFVDKTFELATLDGPAFTLDPESAADLARHTARRANQPGLVELWPIEVPAAPDPADPWDAPLDQMGARHPKTQLAAQVAGEAARILRAGEAVWEEQADLSWQRRAAQAGDILILVQNRTGGLFDALIAALKAEGLPVAGADRLVLADHIGVQDCLNLMRFALLPGDDLTLAEILRGPFCGLTEDNRHLFPLAYGRGTASLWSRLQASEDPAHTTVKTFLDRLRADRAKPAYEFLMDQLNTPAPQGETGWAALIGQLGMPAYDPVRALLNKALSQDARGPASLQVFLAEMDRDRSQIKRDLAAPGGEIRIMTAHGAKGLQAPIVIMPDTTRAPKARTGEVFLLDGVPAWSRRTEDDTPEIHKARDEAKARSLAEHRRLLYVALTRAQDRLILFGHWHGARPKDGEEKDGFAKQSWYQLCQEAMDNLACAQDATSARLTDVRRFGQLPATLASGTQSTPPLPENTPDWLTIAAPPSKARGGASYMIAPSALAAKDEATLAPFGPGRQDRLKRGRLIHALLQRLPDIAPAERMAAGAAFLHQDASLSEEARAEMLTAAMGVLNAPELAHLFADGGRAEAAIVGRIPNLAEDLIINGRVDRLIVQQNEVLIVDFKTDQPAPRHISGISEAYLAQMGAYAAVLREAWPGRTVHAALVWTDGPRIMPLPTHLIEKALTRSTKAD